MKNQTNLHYIPTISFIIDLVTCIDINDTIKAATNPITVATIMI